MLLLLKKFNLSLISSVCTSEMFIYSTNTFLQLLGTDDEDHEYDYLGAWGPRFDKLDKMYGPEPGQEIDEL